MSLVTPRKGYKLVNLGKKVLDLEIPRSWNAVKINDVIKKRSNKIELNPKKKYFRITVKRRHGGVVLRDKIEGDKILTKNQFKVCSGDYILTHKQVIHGSGGIIPKELDGAVVSGEYSQFYGSDLLDINYFDLFSHTEIFHKMIILTTQGVHIEKFVFLEKEWLNFKLPLPPLPEQQKIIAILSNVDNLIESTEKVITYSKKVKKGLMQKLLTRGIGHKKFKKVPWLFGKEIEIPEEWEVKKLQNVTDKIGDGIHSTPNYVDNSEYYFINGNNLINGKIMFSENTKNVNEEEFLKYELKLNKNTVLLSINGTIGNVAFYNNEKIVLGKSASYIICNDNLDVIFFFYLLQSNIIKKYLSTQLTGTTIFNLSLGSIRNMKLYKPPLLEQQKIASILSNIDNKIESQEQYKEKLERLKKSLMQKLLTGEVRV